ncbi:ribonuclease G [Thiohalorhabdus denitrificans]|uniref:Ribonuclease G n=1 Tax=Thiohalorhabdus denitrificans TaxID=381306 RepID=A0A0P9ELT4_9GAMM|nr:ribonuclease G [Thiohalorhabdus denitrificans]KPV39551.1 ribonuclease G [Thiohalorhabdus denitrificans]SCX98937.1 RNAse G [Thiohalorhabdus denitrificans]
MSGSEILINVTPQEVRVAIVENGLLQEVHIERPRTRGIVGNIYKGKVGRVLPGMQAAFIDIGLEKAAFLHASDVLPPENTDLPRNGQEPKITELLREGDEVVVQVNKDPLGTKGARVSTQITLPSRFLVYMPYIDRVGVSRRIDGVEERTRLKEAVEAFHPPEEPGGFIVRTVSEGVREQEFERDVRFLRRLWESLQADIRTAKAPALIHEDFTLPMRAMRDMVDDQVDKVRIDSRETWDQIQTFARDFVPEVADRIEYYPGERPIFDLYSVEEEIQRSLDRTVYLKSGGHLVIDQTEALTSIDVNTGGFVGRKTLEETILKTNLEAAQAIARQLRLRNLGGIIIIDFIDMEKADHRERVFRALEYALSRDRSKSHLVGFSELGLVEMTRKRTRESLERLMTEPCPYCQGRGRVKSLQTVCYEIFRETLREARQYPAEQLLILANPSVVDVLLDEESKGLADLEAFIGKSITLRSEAGYTQEQFDVVVL